MYKRCTSYTLVSQPPTEKALINQGCIKSCILRKKNPCQSPSAIRVLFYGVYQKETLCQLVLYILYSLKNRKTYLFPVKRGRFFLLFSCSCWLMPHGVLGSLFKIPFIIQQEYKLFSTTYPN